MEASALAQQLASSQSVVNELREAYKAEKEKAAEALAALAAAKTAAALAEERYNQLQEKIQTLQSERNRLEAQVAQKAQIAQEARVCSAHSAAIVIAAKPLAPDCTAAFAAATISCCAAQNDEMQRYVHIFVLFAAAVGGSSCPPVHARMLHRLQQRSGADDEAHAGKHRR